MRPPLLLALLTACAEVPDAPADTDGCPGSEAPPALDPTLVADLQAELDTWLLNSGGPGVVLGVRTPDGAWLGAVGVGDVEAPAPLDPATDAFAIGSITKTFVTVLVLKLVDDGLLSLDDTIDRWYGGVIPDADRITVRLLLQHGSGLVDYTDTSEFVAMLGARDASRREIDDVIALCADDGLRFEPGTAFDYSNTNFFVAGRLAERVTGRPLAELLRERVLAPAGLGHTWLLGYEDPPACTRLVGGHLGGTPDFAIDGSWQWASGGLASTAPDLLDWIDALLDGDVVTDTQRVLMTTPSGLPEDGAPTDYGTGFRVRDEACGTLLGHTGSTMGFQSDLFRQAEDGFDVVALQNDFTTEVSDVASGACGIVREALR